MPYGRVTPLLTAVQVLFKGRVRRTLTRHRPRCGPVSLLFKCFLELPLCTEADAAGSEFFWFLGLGLRHLTAAQVLVEEYHTRIECCCGRPSGIWVAATTE